MSDWRGMLNTVLTGAASGPTIVCIRSADRREYDTGGLSRPHTRELERHASKNKMVRHDILSCRTIPWPRFVGAGRYFVHQNLRAPVVV